MRIKPGPSVKADLLTVCGGDRVYVYARSYGQELQAVDAAGFYAHLRYFPRYEGGTLPSKREPYLRGSEPVGSVPYDIDFGYVFPPLPGQLQVVGGNGGDLDVFYTVTASLPRALSRADIEHTLTVTIERDVPLVVPRPRGATHLTATSPSFVRYHIGNNLFDVPLTLGTKTALGPAEKVEFRVGGLYFFTIVL